MAAARTIPLDPDPEYEVVFAPEIAGELLGLERMDEVVLELERTLALRFDQIGGQRIEKVEATKAPALYKYRPHADNGLRFLFAVDEPQKRRIVLACFPRKNDYRTKDLKTAAERFRRFLELPKQATPAPSRTTSAPTRRGAR